MKKRIQKIKLKLPAEYNFKLIGIVSSENDYTLIWTIDNTLNISLKKENELEIVDKKTQVLTPFTRFYFRDENADINYTLIANKSEKGYLIKEQKQVDFFLKIESETDSTSSSVIKKLKKTKNILAIFDILPTDLKSKDNLLF